MTGNYFELVFTVVNADEYLVDLLIAELADIGFDSFETNELGFRAYIPSAAFDEAKVQDVVAGFKDDFTFGYELNLIPYKNWNEVWESNFQPVVIADQLYIYADFHEVDRSYPHLILMHPKMAFGTGHHETTFQMAEQILPLDLEGKSVLDMGCGTGILAILAHQKGAKPIMAIDIDPVAAESCIENFQLNGVSDATVLCGDASLLKDKHFDILFANINRNILLNDMPVYADALRSGGFILFSGFYTEDLDAIKESALANQFTYIEHHSKNNWVVARFQKI